LGWLGAQTNSYARGTAGPEKGSADFSAGKNSPISRDLRLSRLAGAENPQIAALTPASLPKGGRKAKLAADLRHPKKRRKIFFLLA
jgi:hypothetical protein